MKRRIEIILQHGWAFDKSCWRGWMPHLRENTDCEITIQTPDRGYFGEAREVVPFENSNSLKIVIAHSLGLHLLAPELLQSADLLVLASTFSALHSGSPLEQRITKKKVNSIRKRLQESPLEEIHDFYSNCYHPLLTSQMLLKRDAETLDIELLEKDLETLDSNVFDLNIIKNVPQVLLVHGSEDIIVPAAHSHDMNKALPASDMIIFEGVGHSLPITHVAPVWISLRSKIRHLLSVTTK